MQDKGGLQYIYELDHDFVSMKKHLIAKHDFYEFFTKAVENYIDGDWVNAQSNLNSAQQMISHADGPSAWMGEYLESNKNLAPDNWRGYRDLDMKQREPPDFDSGLMGRAGETGPMD
mmetsp:Transcript_2397/g.3305  ORF Transcript_2397/g.3305 Transcript_2397/m.3305 type:complete len:117 (-) Transcript_2397:125-475(-)